MSCEQHECILPVLYESHSLTLQKERKAASKKVKGGPFKLNSHPKDAFEDNPYKTDDPQPIYREPKRGGDKLKPFRPSNPAKLVRNSSMYVGRGPW